MIGLLKEFRRSGEQESLHKFRVQVKKIWALLPVFFNKKKGARVFMPIRSVFKAAGVVRERYVQLQVVGVFLPNSSPELMRGNHLLNRASLRFLRKGRGNIRKLKKAKVRINKDLHALPEKRTVKYHRRLLDAIVLALAKRDFTGEMHRCRKQIKCLLYTQKAWLIKKRKLNLNTQYLGKVENAIGRWHDGLVAKEALSGKKSYRFLVLKLDEEISRMERSVTALTANFWQKAAT